MPPKRKGAAGKAKAGGKRTKADAAKGDEAKPATVQDAISHLKAVDKNKVKKAKPDENCPLASTASVGDFTGVLPPISDNSLACLTGDII